jgi:hypothetical protein
VLHQSPQLSPKGRNKYGRHKFLKPTTPASSIDEAECASDKPMSASDYGSSYGPTWSPKVLEDDNFYKGLMRTEAWHNEDVAQYRACVSDSSFDSSPVLVRSYPYSPPSKMDSSIKGPRWNRQETVMFELSGQKAIFYESLRSQKAVRGFIASQIAVDKHSKFLYTTDNAKEPREARNQEDLVAIWDELRTVIVCSKQGHFASTQHPIIVKQ